MAVYVVLMMKIEDADGYKKYTDRSPEIVKRYGGKFLTRGQEVKTFEGKEYEDRMVILEFPDQESVDGWYNDSDYQDALVFRKASSVMHMLLVQEGS